MTANRQAEAVMWKSFFIALTVGVGIVGGLCSTIATIAYRQVLDGFEEIEANGVDIRYVRRNVAEMKKSPFLGDTANDLYADLKSSQKTLVDHDERIMMLEKTIYSNLNNLQHINR